MLPGLTPCSNIVSTHQVPDARQFVRWKFFSTLTVAISCNHREEGNPGDEGEARGHHG